ncbi:MAG: hypothetical protein ACRC20_01340 [Segniliparus sp.]|uniref:hypothetical protein n=1 Tax=Segniliparus sp. TaxID=2804064 RepID=UPI003F2E85BD
MRPRGRTGLTVAGALVLSALATAGLPGRSAADPDFPTIPSRSPADASAPELEAKATEPDAAPQPSDGEEAASSGLASGRDCAVIKYLVSHVDVILGKQVQITQAFPAADQGAKAVAQDLDVLNAVLPFLVSAEANLQDSAQRAKVVAYKNDLGQLSLVIADRQKQNLTAPAPYEWAERLVRANGRAGADYARIGDSCLV